ncbi:hypothetical protein [Nocardia aurea]|uniref:hypothetical protein n=1 Tax=Nocardia aurea TaxID=2144174 RepID=UPI0033B18905
MGDYYLERVYTGSRRHPNPAVVARELRHDRRTAWNEGLDLFVQVGDCPTGVDSAVRTWCRKELPDDRWAEFKADWHQHGRAAGPIRNREMLSSVHFAGARCVAFPLRGRWQDSKGTWDCVTAAVEAGIPVDIVPPDAPRFTLATIAEAKEAMR